MLVPEIALTPAAAALFRARVRRARRHPAQRPVRRRAPRPVAAHPPRRRSTSSSARDRPCSRRSSDRPDRRRRGARRVVQAGGEPALPRPRRRDRARAQRAGALVVLGSATPSLEIAANARAGRYERVVLERRVLDRPLAAVSDRRHARGVRGRRAGRHPEPRARRRRSAMRLDRREQALVLLNRRGFATVVFCRQCGAHDRVPATAACRWSSTARRAPRARATTATTRRACRAACPLVRRRRISSRSGFGTERVEAEVRARVSRGARVARLDRDTVRRKGAIAARPAAGRAPARSTCWSARR